MKHMNKRLPRWLEFGIGAAMIGVPWVGAALAVRSDPGLADAQGAYSLATYASVLLVPLGLIAIASSFRR